MLLYYMRHGDPIYDPDSLTELGEKQAEALSNRLKLCGLDEIYVSSSNRAFLTAKPTIEKLGIKFTTVDFLNENYPWRVMAETRGGNKKWLYRFDDHKKELLSKEALNLGTKWYELDCFKNKGLKEYFEKFNKDVDNFMLSIGYEHNREGGYYIPKIKSDRRIGIFAHQGMGICFLSSLLDIPYNLFCTKFDIGISSYTIVRFDDHDTTFPCILQLSNDSHLYKEGLPLIYNRKVDI